MMHKQNGRLTTIPVAKIVPNTAQPRQDFEPCAIMTLAESIKQNGLLQPITVCKIDDGYMLIAGERRWRAFRLLGERQIPAIVIKADEQKQAILALIENLHREDLNCFETAYALKEILYTHHLTQDQLAKSIGVAQSTLANKLRLLQLDKPLQEQILKAGLTERHGRALIAVPSEKRQRVLNYIIKQQLNVADTEKYIESLLAPKKIKGTIKGNIRDIRIFINTLNHAVDMMKKAGVPATATQEKQEDFIEYRIIIPVKPKCST